MKQTADDLQKLDALQYVRDNPNMFLPYGKSAAWAIANGLSGDALVLGAIDVRVFRYDQWWIVAADKDWLDVPCSCPAGPQDAFSRLLGFPEAGVNSHRHEIIATAYANSVISISSADRFVVSGNVADCDAVWGQLLTGNMQRAVAFRMDA